MELRVGEHDSRWHRRSRVQWCLRHSWFECLALNPQSGKREQVDARGDQAVHVEQHHHLVVHRREAADAGGIGAGAEIRRRLHRIGGHVVDLRDRVDHDANGLFTDRRVDAHDDDHRRAVEGLRFETEARAQVDDRHDDAAQVHDTEDVRRRVGHARHAVPALDLLHAQDFDAVLDSRAHEGHVLGTARGVRLRGGGFSNGCRLIHLFVLL